MFVIPQLSAECEDLLATAAVIGSSFDVDVLAAAVGKDTMTCLDLLAEAQRLGVVTPGDGPDRQRFVAPEVHTAVLERVPASARVRLHAAVAEAVATVHAERIDAHLFELAAHWSAAAIGDYRPIAARWIGRAATAALRDAKYKDAVRLFRRALDVGANGTAPEERCRMLLDLATASYRCSGAQTSRLRLP